MTHDDILSENSFKFIPYNTGMPHLPLPEYGRNIQNMVDYCVEIPDREERTVCAHAIVGVMRTLFPQNVGENGDMKKFWDHLNIMARFELDIDFPCEVVTADTVNPKPRAIPYGKSPIRIRHYGRSLAEMVKIVADMEPGKDRDEKINLIANQMKKLLLVHNPEGVDDARVLRDLYDLSAGKINLVPGQYLLHEFHEVTPTAKKTKKKMKKNRKY